MFYEGRLELNKQFVYASEAERLEGSRRGRKRVKRQLA